MSKWNVEKLDTTQHQREAFDCGIDVLNLFLKTRANQEQKKRLNVTYVGISVRGTTPKPIQGYYTLSNSSIALSIASGALTKHVPPTYEIPSVKIGRLAVHKTLHGQGLGHRLLRDAFKRIIEIGAMSAIKCVEVVAKDKRAIEFYKKFGFQQLVDKQNMLVIPVQTIIRAVDVVKA